MARKRRSCPAGLTFHLCNRSAGGITLFQTPFDYVQVLEVFREALKKFPVSVFAYCIMPNHWHLLAQAQEPRSISRFMHWFGTTHAARWRSSHNSTGQGAVYQNRFRSHLVEGATAFLKTAAYIERNPLTSELVREVTAWPWGSAGPRQTIPLKAWPAPKPKNWIRSLAHPHDAEVLRQIRHATVSATPFRDHCLAETSETNIPT